MKRLVITLGIAFCAAQGYAQNSNKNGFDEFRKSIHEEFNNFRKQCMEEYADFIRNPWKEFEGEAPVPMPKEKPVPPVVMPEEDKDKPIENKPIIIKGVVKPMPISPQPKPLEPIKEIPVTVKKNVDITLYGTPISVRFDINNRVQLRGIEKDDIADALTSINPEHYDNMLIDCLNARDRLKLSDWAYLQMLKELSYRICGKDTNEATLMMAYLYMQSGYKMRFATNNNKLYMLFASKHLIYDLNAYRIDGFYYYGVEGLPSKLIISMAAYPEEKCLSMLVPTNQQFTYLGSEEREIASSRYPDIKISVSVNKNLIDFYNTYPASMIDDNFMTKWAMYANTPMDEGVKKDIYSELKEKLKGASQIDAVNKLLNLVQTGLVYEYDDKVWGCDRAFFAEESLFYPYCDCEDRSILFTRLVRDLLGLKCVLVYYPGHLASAVEFTESDVQGDYLQLDGHKYIVTDATYINAPVGRTMPGMNNSDAQVILLE